MLFETNKNCNKNTKIVFIDSNNVCDTISGKINTSEVILITLVECCLETIQYVSKLIVKSFKDYRVLFYFQATFCI